MSDSSILLKPIITAGIVVALDQYVMKTRNINESFYFGAAAAVGTYAGGMVAKAMPIDIGSGSYFDSKTVEMRVAEVAIGAGSGYAINRFVLKNEYNKNDLIMKLGIIAGSDFVAEYLTDYLAGRKLSFLTE